MDALPPLCCWVDLEMTGLNPERDVILELGVMLTNASLEPLGSLHHVVWQPPAALQSMEPVVLEMHRCNGLLDEVPVAGVPVRQAERDAVELMRQHAAPGTAVLCGNSVHTDRAFLARHMPMFERYLHYQHLDVTSVRLFMQGLMPGLEPTKPASTGRAHRAMDDLKASQAELATYRALFANGVSK